MANLTPNYNLIQPEPTDEYGDFLQAFNDDMEIIDQNLGGGGGGSSTLAGLNDVSLTTPITNDALIYDGAEWVNTPLAAVAFSGDYSDLQNAPSIPTKVSDLTNDSGFLTSSDVASVAMSGDYSDLSNTPSLATVATSGDYSDLSNTPNLATVATSGDYSDLSNTPTIPTAVSDLTNDEGFTAVGWTQIQASGTKIAEIEIDGVSQDVYAPTGGSGSGGHTIKDESGTAFTQRTNLQFGKYTHVTDDSTNDVTIIDTEPEEVTWAVWQTMTSAQKANKHWIITNAPDAVANAGEIDYDNTNSGLNAIRVQGAIDALADSSTKNTIGYAGGFGSTYSDYLTALYSYYQDLTAEEKLNCYIKMNGILFRPSTGSDGRFTAENISINAVMNIYGMDLVTPQFMRYSIGSSGNITVTDMLNSTYSGMAELYVRR